MWRSSCGNPLSAQISENATKLCLSKLPTLHMGTHEEIGFMEYSSMAIVATKMINSC